MATERTWDDQRLKRDRLLRLQDQMQRRGIGALYLDEAVHLRYVLNLHVPGGQVFVPAHGEPIGFIRRRDMGYVQLHHARVQLPLDEGSDGERDSPDVAKRIADGIVDLMRQHGADDGDLAVDTLGVGTLLPLLSAGVRIVDAESLFEHTWTVKTPDEIELYRALGDQYAHTITAFRDALRPGITENELAASVVAAWYQAGGADIAQLNVCAGENMNPWRRWPTARPVRDGEFVGIDLHGRGINGLRGDASRTFFVGEHPDQAQRDLYRRAYDYLQGSIDAFRAGRSIADVMASVPPVPEAYRAQQLNYNTGHGIGLGSSGYPHMDPRKRPLDDVLQENQVLSVECYFGAERSPLAVKLEEQIVVRDGEPEILSPHIPFDDRFLRFQSGRTL